MKEHNWTDAHTPSGNVGVRCGRELGHGALVLLEQGEGWEDGDGLGAVRVLVTEVLGHNAIQSRGL